MMQYNHNNHHRRSIRLKGYDYSQEGLYFITICCQNLACLFGEITVGATLVVAQNDNAQMMLNDKGKMIEAQWLALTERFTNIQLHEFIVMPNHFHGIIEITVGSTTKVAVGATLVVAQNTAVAQNNLVADNTADAVGATLVVAQDNLVDAEYEGRPQGHAPTDDQTNTIVAPNVDQTYAITSTIGDMMGAYKSNTTVEYIRGIKNLGWQPFNGKLWQRNYYEHIIRNERSYQKISNYIKNNPAKWKDDKFYIKELQSRKSN